MEDNGDTYHYKRLLEALFLKGLKHMVDFQSCRVYRIILGEIFNLISMNCFFEKNLKPSLVKSLFEVLFN